MKTRLLFCVLLMGGVGLMTLNGTRDTSAGVVLSKASCEKWTCANRPVPYDYYDGYDLNEEGDWVFVGKCDIGATLQAQIVTCMVPTPNYGCQTTTPNSLCLGQTNSATPDVCWVHFWRCTGTVSLPDE